MSMAYSKFIFMILAPIFLLGCNHPKATNSTISKAERKELASSFAKLDSVLTEHSPFIHERLSPPATEGDISELRTALGGAERQSLECWYKWHNGCNDRLVDILPLGRMLSIKESIEDRDAIQEIPFIHARRKRAIKLLEDVAGDGFYIDLSLSKPHIYYEMLEDPHPTDYGTMAEFLEFITRIHASNIVSVDSRGMIQFDEDEYERIESEHLSKTDRYR